MKKIYLAIPAAIGAALVSCSQKQNDQPNILLIVADDLGLGDVSAYGSRTISTPNIDRLANEGIRFDNAYSSSATSTPSRYAMFTGLYPWKNPDAKILQGDAPLLITPGTPTLPKALQSVGYQTAAIGKWHLGMGDGYVNWNEQISPSANSVGFDYTCLIAATNDRVPTVYVENGLVEGWEATDSIFVDYHKNFEGEPTALSNPELLKMHWSHGHNNSVVNGIGRIGFMKGGQKARWVDEDMADYFLAKFKNFIDGRKKSEPFFIYYGLHQPHVPRAPHQRFVGASGMGPRGDAIVEADWCVGELIAYLDKKGLLENTLVIFTSDNGAVIDDGYKDDAVEKLGNHDPMNGLRGGKYSLFDAGTHVPMISYWKGRIDSKISDAFVTQIDFFESFAALADAEVADGLDSQNLLPAFLGESEQGRENMVIEAQGRLAFKSGWYTLIPPYKGPTIGIVGIEYGNVPEWTLYDLSSDPAQTRNLASELPEVVDSLRGQYKSLAVR